MRRSTPPSWGIHGCGSRPNEQGTSSSEAVPWLVLGFRREFFDSDGTEAFESCLKHPHLGFQSGLLAGVIVTTTTWPWVWTSRAVACASISPNH